MSHWPLWPVRPMWLNFGHYWPKWPVPISVISTTQMSSNTKMNYSYLYYSQSRCQQVVEVDTTRASFDSARWWNGGFGIANLLLRYNIKGWQKGLLTNWWSNGFRFGIADCEFAVKSLDQSYPNKVRDRSQSYPSKETESDTLTRHAVTRYSTSQKMSIGRHDGAGRVTRWF